MTMITSQSICSLPSTPYDIAIGQGLWAVVQQVAYDAVKTLFIMATLHQALEKNNKPFYQSHVRARFFKVVEHDRRIMEALMRREGTIFPQRELDVMCRSAVIFSQGPRAVDRFLAIPIPRQRTFPGAF